MIAELRTKKSCGTAIADLQNLTSATLCSLLPVRLLFSRAAEPENLKTVPVPTFYLNTVPVPAPVPGHIHAYLYTYTYMFRVNVPLILFGIFESREGAG